MSRLFRFGANALIAVWTLVCLAAYVLVEVLGETFVDAVSAVLGTAIGSLIGFLHDIGMVALVLVWLVVAWSIRTAGKAFGAR